MQSHLVLLIHSVYTVFIITLVVPLQIKLFFYLCACLVSLYPLSACFLIPSILVLILALTFSFIIVLFTNYNHILDCSLVVIYFLLPSYKCLQTISSMRAETKCVFTLLCCYSLYYAWPIVGTQKVFFLLSGVG